MVLCLAKQILAPMNLVAQALANLKYKFNIKKGDHQKDDRLNLNNFNADYSSTIISSTIGLLCVVE